MSRTLTLVLAALLPLAVTSQAEAHSHQSASIHVRVDAQGVLSVDLKTKAEPFFHVLDSKTLTLEGYRGLSGLREAERVEWLGALRKVLVLAVEFSIDGTRISPKVEIPTPADGDEWLRARYVSSRSKAPKTLTVLNGLALGKLLVRVTWEGHELGGEVFLDPRTKSGEFSLVKPAAAPSRGAVALQYLVLGFEHILPKGLDHILFVLGLFLLSKRMKPLLFQITAFTVAHSVTLALSMYGVVSLPSSVVEPLIALSIVYVAVENVFTDKLKPWRSGVVFLFGLLHGLGFAGVLSELGIPRERFVTALVTFNVGVELGQVCVVLIAMALVWRVREREWFRKRIVIPASVLIALTGLYWCVERTLL